MPISRRQFFRGIVRQNETREPDLHRKLEEIDAYVRTNLLPYDFGLSVDQTAQLLTTVREAMDVQGADDLFTAERRQRMYQIVEETLSPWREEFWQAEEMRRSAPALVEEFVEIEISSEQRRRLGERFSISYPNQLNEEIVRQVQTWLAGLPHAQLAACNVAALRELVFSELMSWC